MEGSVIVGHQWEKHKDTYVAVLQVGWAISVKFVRMFVHLLLVSTVGVVCFWKMVVLNASVGGNGPAQDARMMPMNALLSLAFMPRAALTMQETTRVTVCLVGGERTVTRTGMIAVENRAVTLELV